MSYAFLIPNKQFARGVSLKDFCLDWLVWNRSPPQEIVILIVALFF